MTEEEVKSELLNLLPRLATDKALFESCDELLYEYCKKQGYDNRTLDGVPAPAELKSVIAILWKLREEFDDIDKSLSNALRYFNP